MQTQMGVAGSRDMRSSASMSSLFHTAADSNWDKCIFSSVGFCGIEDWAHLYYYTNIASQTKACSSPFHFTENKNIFFPPVILLCPAAQGPFKWDKKLFCFCFMSDNVFTMLHFLFCLWSTYPSPLWSCRIIYECFNRFYFKNRAPHMKIWAVTIKLPLEALIWPL